MAGGLFSLAKPFGMTIRESATDGSDFTNPDADYRRLFLGEDGKLHLKDSAGTVTEIGGSVAEITDIPTAELDDTLVLAPDGAGGVEFRAEAGGAGLATGTSFPGAPTAGDRYRRSDKDYMVFLYDGAQWVTEQIHELYLGGNLSTAAAAVSTVFGRVGTSYPHYTNLWLLDFRVGYYLDTTNDGSKYWTLNLRSISAAIGVSTLETISTAADSTSTGYRKYSAVDALVGTDVILDFYAAKNSTPSVINCGGSVTFRGVAT